MIDMTVLEQQFGEDAEEMFAELLPIFIDDNEPLIATLRTASETQDADLLYKTAHAIKGGAATLGITDLAKVTGEIEKLGRAGSTEGADELISLAEQLSMQVADLQV